MFTALQMLSTTNGLFQQRPEELSCNTLEILISVIKIFNLTGHDLQYIRTLCVEYSPITTEEITKSISHLYELMIGVAMERE